MRTTRNRRFADLAQDPEVRDGDRVTFPLTLMDGHTVHLCGDDALTGAVLTAAVIEAGRRSGLLTDQHEETTMSDSAIEKAHAEYDRRIGDAWRQPIGATAASAPPPPPVADGGADYVEAAYRAYDRHIADAWRAGR